MSRATPIVRSHIRLLLRPPPALPLSIPCLLLPLCPLVIHLCLILFSFRVFLWIELINLIVRKRKTGRRWSTLSLLDRAGKIPHLYCVNHLWKFIREPSCRIFCLDLICYWNGIHFEKNPALSSAIGWIKEFDILI